MAGGRMRDGTGMPRAARRIGRRLNISSLTPDDTAEYVRLRLKAAGCDKELFTSDAIGMLHEAAVGALRDIDRIATAALRETARKKRKLVERDTLARILDAESTEAQS